MAQIVAVMLGGLTAGAVAKKYARDTIFQELTRMKASVEQQDAEGQRLLEALDKYATEPLVIMDMLAKAEPAILRQGPLKARLAEVFVGENATYLPMLQQLCEQRNVIVAEALLDRLPIMNLDKGKLGSYIPAGIATICTLDREIKTTWNIFGFLDDRLDAKRDNFKHTIERLLEVICHRLRITKDELLLYADETQKKVLQKFLPTQEERSPRLTLQDIVVDHYHLFNADDFNELKNNTEAVYTKISASVQDGSCSREIYWHLAHLFSISNDAWFDMLSSDFLKSQAKEILMAALAIDGRGNKRGLNFVDMILKLFVGVMPLEQRMEVLHIVQIRLAGEKNVFIQFNEKGDITERLDLNAVRKESLQFYQEHNLQELSAALPQEIKLSAENKLRILEAQAEGYDCAMIMAPTELQSGNILKLLDECATKPVNGLSKDDQYTAPYIYDKDVTLKAKTQNRPKKKAYLILYKSNGVEPETRDKTFDECDAIFQAKNAEYQAQGKQMRIVGFTTPEYLLAQRKACEEHKDHRFDAYSGPAQSQWTGLLDSKTPSGSVNAYWNPSDHQVDVYWNRSMSSDVGLGARSAVIIELEI
ncbi:MAG: hypothetical protein A2233_01730 [Candidatus Kerfeldbacteria bacterium RIFOXYA2_FULL_38_24]|nr:MAG: hypothetical protein A2233_01730 [Candidatus Kerfeldbacteria bacterium RIFOXYA2_FULL_38_24]